MFSKHKRVAFVFSLSVVSAIIIFVVYINLLSSRTIYYKGTDIPIVEGAVMTPDIAVLSALRNARASGMMFLKDNIDMTFEQIMDVWPGLNVGNTSFDQYMENPLRLKDYSFLVVPDPETREQMLLIGTRIGDPKLARKVIDLDGAAILGPTGLSFTDTDGFVYMRIK